jgi:AbrB family looped-hinge helix DNA binding protein
MSSHRVRLGEGGRLVIPAAIRKELGLKVGDDVILEVDDGALRVRSLKDAIAHAQALVRRHVPEGRSLADELIAERRREAARE